ncbi:MAG: 6-phosphogluconolactonase [Clostridia bacterium]|nr:6-phosphogluconolactonase [Clostridia bacterium]
MKTMKSHRLSVQIHESRDAMGKAAAADIAACIHSLLKTKDQINMIFAAAPSQNEVLHYLCEDATIPWERIHAFHMDEYVGIAPDAPQGFAQFLRRAIFDRKPFASVNLIDSTAEPQEEAVRYSQLLAKNPPDIVCMGIGENGHIAFNDPHVADFQDPAAVKVVDLDDVCRMQQVHDGCFASLELVPKYAMTLTVPTLAGAAYQFCVVPAAAKAQAVKNTVSGEIGAHCPATVLRNCENAVLYCDPDSAALL